MADGMALGWMFSPKGTQRLAPRIDTCSLASPSMRTSNGKLKWQSTFWCGRMTRLPAMARSLKLDLRMRPGTVCVRTRAAA